MEGNETPSGRTEPHPESDSDSEFDDGLAISDVEVMTPQLGGDRRNAFEPWSTLPFDYVHKESSKFKSPQRPIFIPGQEIDLKITDHERSVTTHLLNPNLYTIEVRHGDFHWTIKKRYKDILHLHQQLRLFKASMNFPIPTKTHRELRTSFKEETIRRKKESDRSKTKRSYLRFPARPEGLVPYEKVESRARQLEQYLRNLLKIKYYRNHHETVDRPLVLGNMTEFSWSFSCGGTCGRSKHWCNFSVKPSRLQIQGTWNTLDTATPDQEDLPIVFQANFLEVSEFSFIGALGGKGKEGMVQKRTRSTTPGASGCNFCGCFGSIICLRCHYVCGDVCASWRTRWLIVKDNFVAYIRPKDGRVKAVLLFDSGFEVTTGIFATGLRRGLIIMNLQRSILVNCPTRRTAREWQIYIKDTARKEGKTEWLLGGDFTQRNRYFSFCPVRSDVEAGWLVDGRAYMATIASVLEQAKQEIFIADWWLSPEIHMKRPSNGSDHFRLDIILKRKADEGVKVFILLYKEVEMALGINSYYSKQQLIGPNIKVLRHPDHAKAGVFLWAHHEKLVVVDQSIAFVGGIDLCYGRWDDHRHKLTDLGSQEEKNAQPPNQENSPKSPTNSKDLTNNNVTVETDSEDFMFDPSPENIKRNTPEMERKSLFETVRVRGRHFMNRWAFSSDDEDDETGEKDATDNLPFNLSTVRSISEIQDQELPTSNKIWLGKDYTNFIVKDFENLELPFQDLVDRTKTPRMPWHDVGTVVRGSPARDVARHFIQRWNSVKLEKSNLNPQYPYLLPKAYNEFSHFELPGLHVHKVSCQVVRSIGQWSGGLMDSEIWEGSIHDAYVDAIIKARHYVYLENQFFISCTGQHVRNQVADALFKRIRRAHKEGSVFRVYIILPLLPGFEGEVGTPSGTALHAITHWNYASICRGKDSLLGRLKESGVTDPEEYVTFHGLRNHSALRNVPVTELIYVHSKLLIVDDRLVICGSANINDRSLVGKRDSEIAVVIEDEEFKSGLMNGSSSPSGRYCGSLRRFLFREHLGLLTAQNSVDVTDPISKEFYHDVWRATAQSNTKIYDKVFQCLPRDDVKSFKDLSSEKPLATTDPDEAAKLLLQIKGHLVMFPLEFLENEVLTPNPGSVEGMLPTSLWT